MNHSSNPVVSSFVLFLYKFRAFTNTMHSCFFALSTHATETIQLAWMFHSRHLNNKINKIHERALRIAYKDYVSSFDILLERDKSVTIHTKNLQTLMTEIFKTQNSMNPLFMSEIFRERENMYNLRINNEFVIPRITTVNFGSESIRYRGPQLWFSLPQDIRNTDSLSLFKSKITRWHAEECSCRLCRPFIPNVGFL